MTKMIGDFPAAFVRLAEANAAAEREVSGVTDAMLGVKTEERPQPSRLATHGPTEDELLRRAVQNARSRVRAFEHERWVAVADLFELDSYAAEQLCRRFGFDPQEAVEGNA